MSTLNYGACEATFTTNYIPRKPGLDGSFEIPLGFVLSPMAATTTATTTTTASMYKIDTSAYNTTSKQKQKQLKEKDMNMCTNCLAYLNLYCTFDELTGKWICPICKSENVAPLSTFRQEDESGSLIMSSQIVEYCQTAAGCDDDDNDIGHNDNHGNNEYGYNTNSRNDISNVTIIVLDGNLPPNEVQSILSNLSSILSKDKNQMIGLIIYTSIVHIYQVGMQGIIASADIYSSSMHNVDIVDDKYEYENKLENDYNETSVLEDDRMYLGSWDQVKFCANVYFDLNVTSDDTDAKANTGTAQEKKEKDEEQSKENITSNLRKEVGQNNDHSTTNTNEKKPSSRREMLRLKREERLNKNKVSYLDLDDCTPEQAAEWIGKLGFKKKNKNNNSYATISNLKQRCTGEAVAYGLSLVSSLEDRCNGRVLLFTDGCTNVGRGNVTKSGITSNFMHKGGDIIDPEQMEYASHYFDSLGRQGFKNGIGIDVFCSGTSTTLGTQVFLSLVKSSAGYVLSHTSFEGDQFKSNLEYVLAATHMSWTKNQDIESMRMGLACKNWMNVINGCVVDLRMPHYITPTAFNGAGRIVNKEKKNILSNERAVFSSGNSRAAKYDIPTNNLPSRQVLESTRTRINMGRFDPQSTLSVMMQINNPVETDGEKFVYFQFITRYLNPNNLSKLVTRVVTQKMPIFKDEDHEFFNSLNKNALSILLAKEAAYRCMVKEEDRADDRSEKTTPVTQEDVENLAIQTQRDLDTTVRRISRAYFESAPSSSMDIEQSQNQTERSDPPELKNTLRRLHHFRRGNIIGSTMQSIDDRSLLRDLFLRMPLDNCLKMMAPSLKMYKRDTGGSLLSMRVPAETLSLWDDCVIEADNFDCMFIWSGRNTSNSLFDSIRNECEESLREKAKGRFPSPTIHFLNENESMARRFSSRLVPSHGDKEADQFKNFPDLKTLSEDELKTLRSKFWMYDRDSDSTFLHWFAIVSNETEKMWRNENSLCE